MKRISLLDTPDEGGHSQLHRRATLLLNHFPANAVSNTGREVAREYLASNAGRAAFLLSTLPGQLFIPYIPVLLQEARWSRPTWSNVLQSVSVLESMYGCKYQCKMCCTRAPMPDAKLYMPYFHIEELLAEIADERRRILRDEVMEVLVNEVLRGRLKLPFSVLDAVMSLVRHARNRFANYSDHLICYWKSNPTDYKDLLLGKDFADICDAVMKAFQLFHLDELVALIDGDAASQARFKADFGEDIQRLYFATSTHAVTSTVPFNKGSFNDTAVHRIIGGSPLGSELVRVSVPHPNLIKTGEGNPERYWASVQHSLRAARPKLVYLFASTITELHELVAKVSETFTSCELPWWTESRLALYEIIQGRKRGDTDIQIVQRLRRVLKKLCFTGKLEGSGKQFAGSPLFTTGSVMCVNGVVLAPDRKVHYQSCTTVAGEDLDEGQIIQDIHTLDEQEVTALVTSHPLTNRARELITPGIKDIPLHERRKPWHWFESTVVANRQHERYQEALAAVAPTARRLLSAVRL